MHRQRGRVVNPEQEAFFRDVAEILRRGTTLTQSDLERLAPFYNYKESAIRAGLFTHGLATAALKAAGVDHVMEMYKGHMIHRDGNLAPEQTDIKYKKLKIKQLVFEASDRAYKTRKAHQQELINARATEERLFPSLNHKTLSIKAGEYGMRKGEDRPIDFDPANLAIFDDNQVTDDPMSGVRYRGWYREQAPDGEENLRQVVSFLYHKLDSTGALETTERAIIWEGIGFGEHPGHAGQEPTWYLVGPQIGTFDTQTGDFSAVPEAGVIEPKHFSLACITDGPLGEAILANPATQQTAA